MHRTPVRMRPRKEAIQGRRHGRRSRGKAARASPTPRCREYRAKSRLAVRELSSPEEELWLTSADLNGKNICVQIVLLVTEQREFSDDECQLCQAQRGSSAAARNGLVQCRESIWGRSAMIGCIYD